MYDVFFIIGTVLFIGFITSLIFERTKFPDVILLMFVGVLLGPIFKIVSIEGTISSLAPYIGTLALIIILFEGGLNLNLFKVLTVLGKATGFTFLVFGLSVASLGISMKFIFGWTYLEGLLLGAVVGGTSSAIVIPIISKLSMSEESSIILSLESALTDALCVIVAIALIEVISLGTVDLRGAASSIASAFSTAAVIGAVFAVFWIGVINKLKHVEYSLTFAIVFILYSVVELIRGNGAIAVLVFALLLGNFSELARRLEIIGDFALNTTLRAFHAEVSFFVRTFFFMFTGLMFSAEAFNSEVVIISGIVFLILFIARILGVGALIISDKKTGPSGKLIIFTMPRGLAAAVLASMPLAAGIKIPYFAETVFGIIILTNLATTVGVFVMGRQKSPEARPQ